MNQNTTKKSLLFFSFLISFAIAAAGSACLLYYMPFLEKTAGTYFIATLFGEQLKFFLIKVLILVGGLLAFVVFFIRGKKECKKPIFPYFMMVSAAFLCLLPIASAYTVSRFAGTLIPQTITAVAIIANVVFMMVAVCAGLLSSIDFIRQISIVPNRMQRGNYIAMILAGIPAGYGLTVLLVPLIEQQAGWAPVYPVLGVLLLITGLLAKLCCNWNPEEEK